VEPVYVPPKALTEADQMTRAERRALLAVSALDLEAFHRFGPKVLHADDRNPYRDFGDILRCYYATGTRTSELAQ
jgi:hypothetical protein